MPHVPYIRSAIFPADNTHAHCAYASSAKFVIDAPCRKVSLGSVSPSVTQSAFASTSYRLLCFPGACVGLIGQHPSDYAHALSACYYLFLEAQILKDSSMLVQMTGCRSRWCQPYALNPPPGIEADWSSHLLGRFPPNPGILAVTGSAISYLIRHCNSATGRLAFSLVNVLCT